MRHSWEADHLGDAAVGFEVGVELLRLTGRAVVIGFTLN